MLVYKIDKSQEIIFTITFGKITIVDVMAHIDNVLSDPDFAPHYHSIVAIDENTVVPSIKPDKIAVIQNVLDGYAQRRKGTKWAVVVFNKRARIMMETSIDLIQPLSANVRIFQSWADAYEWIRDQ
jgi:hypothetical protein